MTLVLSCSGTRNPQIIGLRTEGLFQSQASTGQRDPDVCWAVPQHCLEESIYLAQGGRELGSEAPRPPGFHFSCCTCWALWWISRGGWHREDPSPESSVWLCLVTGTLLSVAGGVHPQGCLRAHDGCQSSSTHMQGLGWKKKVGRGRKDLCGPVSREGGDGPARVLAPWPSALPLTSPHRCEVKAPAALSWDTMCVASYIPDYSVRCFLASLRSLFSSGGDCGGQRQ